MKWVETKELTAIARIENLRRLQTQRILSRGAMPRKTKTQEKYGKKISFIKIIMKFIRIKKCMKRE